MQKLLSSIAVISALFVTANAAFADATINIELIDIGGTIDFSKKMDLRAGGKGDMKMAPVSLKADTASVPAGKVTFAVTNKSKEIQHEMVVSQLATMDAGPTMTADGVKVDEDAAAALGEVAELEPGKTGSVTLDLKPGFYILYCNVEGHYDAGMWAKVEVK
jgi:uncharacterized cupredoxin-like copper-binding protein